MRRHLVVSLAVCLILGFNVPTQAAQKKSKPSARVPANLVYSIVEEEAPPGSLGGPSCKLSTLPAVAPEDGGASCGRPTSGPITGPLTGAGAVAIYAVDSLPFTLDATKPIKGVFTFHSFALNAAPVAPLGTGQAEIHFALHGEGVTIGEVTSEPYLVTPASGTYAVEFEITPSPDLTGKVFNDLALTFEMTGPSVLHGGLSAADENTLTLGVLTSPKRGTK